MWLIAKDREAGVDGGGGEMWYPSVSIAFISGESVESGGLRESVGSEPVEVLSVICKYPPASPSQYLTSLNLAGSSSQKYIL